MQYKHPEVSRIAASTNVVDIDWRVGIRRSIGLAIVDNLDYRVGVNWFFGLSRGLT